ncbi:uncharacterized protein LOC124419439 isoform X2 [Lucilia cuprina]|uniref:uncharacterized protein LOC124419439 isoform X2 n=1 Tax=Lucilia cuprina TaxID=7375 RepID=UPI001F05B5E0|nr:uncharacterized protein LOC124419439 isoform X2 [Lucilia cuprina]
MEGLWKSVLGTEEDVKKIIMARSKLILLVDTLLFVHIQDASTAKQIWDNFINAFHTPSNENSTPEEVWTGRKPTLKHLKVNGCMSIVQVPKEKRKKLDPKENYN